MTEQSLYRGPATIGWAIIPGRGIFYRGDYEGRDVQVSFSLKRKRMRIFVDGVEWVPIVEVER